MTTKKNIWQKDQGFIWMLAISLIALINTQFTESVFGENKFILRSCFFIFTIVAVKSSELSRLSKLTGYFIACVLILLAVILIWSDTYVILLIYSVATTGFTVFIIALVVRQIFVGGIITPTKILGGVAVYILIGLVWTSAYTTIYIVEPSSFQYGGEIIKEHEALKQLSYFSFVTLTTIGYVYIVALSTTARILVILEGLTGQLFPAIFIAKLVALQIEHSRK